MKKALMIAILLMLTACEIGKLEPKREKLYTVGDDICEREPSKCIHGVPW